MPRTEEEKDFLHSVPLGIIEGFRNEIYTKTFIERNPTKFVSNDWIDVRELKEFMKHNVSRNKVIIKREPLDHSVKVEDLPLSLSAGEVRIRSTHENGHETIEILSDSEAEDDPETCIIPSLGGDLSRTGTPSDTTLVGDTGDFSEHESGSDEYIPNSQDMASDDETELPSDTVWLDQDVTSRVSDKPRRLNRQLLVDRVEYVTGLPSYWPVPRVKTAYIIDLRDPKYNIYEGNGHELLTVDAIIKNKDQDSWRGGTGDGDSKPSFDIFTGVPVPCRRSRLDCAGFYACEQVDPKFLNAERYELDPNSLSSIIEAQLQDRTKEANSAEKLVLTFWLVIQSRQCNARDSAGSLCTGHPIMKSYKDSTKRAKPYFIACSGWTRSFRDNHQYHSIPDNVDEHMLARLFAGEELDGFSGASKCSRVIPAHVGGKVDKCRFPHNANGTQTNMKRHNCPASRTIYVPVDPTIRMACIVPNHDYPHSHPVLPASKASRDLRNLYRSCVDAVGVIGSTVQSVENASSTRLILQGKTPALTSPALQSNRLKQDIIRQEKRKLYPCGFGIPGVWNNLGSERKKPVDERYVHNILTTPSDGLLIYTFHPYLLGLVHQAITIQIDTTFKRTVGEFQECEIVIWCAAVHRAVTIGRIYTNRADRTQYKALFDEFQRLTHVITNRRLLFKRFSRGGNLLSLNVDLELAQVQGFGDSFLTTNEPDYSEIRTTDPEILVQYVVRACYTHVKRYCLISKTISWTHLDLYHSGIQKLRPVLNDEQYRRIQDFPYIKTEKEFSEFSTWIGDLPDEVQAWWAHKLDHRWILPAIMPLRTKMNPADWTITQATTNMGESQHHWTNSNTGTKLSLVEAIESARILDNTVAAEIKDSMTAGVLRNNRNDAFNRMSRALTRNSLTARKSQEKRFQDSEVDRINNEIQALSQVRKDNQEKLKELKTRKAGLSSRRSSSYRVGSSSSGRTSSRKGKEQGPAQINEDKLLITWSGLSGPDETYIPQAQAFAAAAGGFGMWDNTMTWPEEGLSSACNLDAQVADHLPGWAQYSDMPIASTSTGLGNYYGNLLNTSTSNDLPYTVSENLLPHASHDQMVMLHNVSGDVEPATTDPSYYAIDPTTEELFNSFLTNTGGS
ncbi:hypothetical protein F5887DRAFT_1090268 [Amanita rubescens]|nr:hypothetical protein F5887DRAFT_1090268 [Amanita rubescens]